MGALHSYNSLNEKLAPKKFLRALNFASGLLISIGKPVFIFLSFVFLGGVFLLYTTGLILARIFDASKLLQPIIKNLKQIKILPPWKKIRKKGVIFISSTKTVSDQLLTHFFKVIKITIHAFFKLSLTLLKILFQVARFISDNFSLLTLKVKLSLLHTRRNFTRILIFFFASTFLWTGLGILLFWIVIMRNLPSPKTLSQRVIPVSTKIYDRNGVLLYTIFKDKNRTPVPISEIPPHVLLATVAIEDAEFYSHPGFSIRGIVRAVLNDVKEKELSVGGSTITQQLVKNTLLTPEKTLIRKLKEVALAVEVELTYSKDEILEMYLNEVSYGGTAYGIEEAARTYFTKNVNKLSLAEAAFLAGLPKSPSRYSPFQENLDGALGRQKDVLELMKTNGFITEEQQKEAENQELTFTENKIEIKAPHFVFYVKELLEEKYGKEVVEKGGLEVVTTLDYQIQELAERAVKEEVEALAKLNVTNGAALVLHPQTGEILAMVGSHDYFDTEHDGNVNVTTRPRQPGSSIKVVNYAYALSNGLTPASVITDSPVTFLVEGQPPYTPKNYEGGYRGNLTLRSALAESRNIPAVKVLASYGVKLMFDMGKKMGITSWSNPDDYGLSLTLGGGDVKLLDLARVYATIANYGVKPELVSALMIKDYKGKVLEEFSCREENSSHIAQASGTESASLNIKTSPQCKGEKVLDERVAFLITDILKDNQARSPSFGVNSLLVIPKHSEVAAKTGTSNDLRDNLAIGYTHNYVVAVWVGNNNNSQMARIASGVTGATPIWNKIMSALLANEVNLATSTNSNWPVPAKLVQVPICPYTGTLACDGCPIKMEWFLEENKPEKKCSPEWFTKDGGSEPIKEEEKVEEKRSTPEIVRPGQFLDILKNQFRGKYRKRQ